MQKLLIKRSHPSGLKQAVDLKDLSAAKQMPKRNIKKNITGATISNLFIRAVLVGPHTNTALHFVSAF